MDSLYIKETKDSPAVYLSVADCKFKISGNSYYVGINELYDKIYKWVNKEIPNLNCNLNIEFYFTMISSSSLKNIIDLLKKLDYFYKIGKKLTISWICDKGDIDLLDIANDFSNLTQIPFTVTERN